MAKFHGVIGYAQSVETKPGVFSDVITEHACRGDVLRNTTQNQIGQSVNDELNISNLFSIVADAFAMGNMQAMRYIQWNGARWKITNVEIQRPRLILTVGGAYHGPTA